MSARCTRNMVAADEQIGAPFRLDYEPCGATATVDVSWRGGETMMCPKHAHEAEIEGCEISKDKEE